MQHETQYEVTILVAKVIKVTAIDTLQAEYEAVARLGNVDFAGIRRLVVCQVGMEKVLPPEFLEPSDAEMMDWIQERQARRQPRNTPAVF